MANKHFEVIVFTASNKQYADAILNYIDPENIYFQHRLYREHCIPTADGVYIKDLRIFQNRDLKDIIIVDNAIYSFGFQLSNGIPIIPFKDDKEDIEFDCLIGYLEKIKDVPDFRVPNRDAFKMEQVHKFNLGNYIGYYTNLENFDSDEETKEESDQPGEDDDSQHDMHPLRMKAKSKSLPKEVDHCLDALQLFFNKSKALHTTKMPPKKSKSAIVS